ncbi:MAG: alternate F1F0 ATPase, F1 subunit alpha [Trichloromonas sp.]|jgi:F-type H+-transporting ATPase subunit alpha|nr:alternate F1F0 ATPase, F1 subunit alpha [Trichloromonas sp.]
MKRTPESLTAALDAAMATLNEAAAGGQARLTPEEIGHITYIGKGIALVDGLPGVRSEELLVLGDGIQGLVFNIDPEQVGVILLGDYGTLGAGDLVRRGGEVLAVPVGEDLLGRVVDPLGRPRDSRGAPVCTERLPVERPAAEVMDRAPVTVPLATGIKVIDALIPIGRGQRELILGDRQTGKSAIAIDTIVNQRGKNVVCIYCAIGQRSASIARVIEQLRRHGALDYTLVVVAEGDDPPGLQYIAPYAATSMGEFFMEQGRDVLVVYDDLTQHARAYRELSLLLRRPPGREAFPGDIFYLHSRLLERSTRLRDERGGGTLTALPIIETEAQNLSAYIPTNLISITDGQIYLSPQLFQKGLLPPVDVGKSVSRVGGKTQLPAYRAVAADLKLSYAQFEELEIFSRFGTRLDDETRRTLERGRKVRGILKQPQLSPLSPAEQVMVLYAVTQGLFDAIPETGLPQAEAAVVAALGTLPEIARAIDQGETLKAEALEAVLAAARKAVSLLLGTGETADDR